MSNLSGFKQKMLSGEILAGTFLKTPNYILVEVLAQSKLDFICLDADHSPFDRAALDQCLSISRALDFPVLVRVGEGSASPPPATRGTQWRRGTLRRHVAVSTRHRPRRPRPRPRSCPRSLYISIFCLLYILYN